MHYFYSDSIKQSSTFEGLMKELSRNNTEEECWEHANTWWSADTFLVVMSQARMFREPQGHVNLPTWSVTEFIWFLWNSILAIPPWIMDSSTHQLTTVIIPTKLTFFFHTEKSIKHSEQKTFTFKLIPKSSQRSVCIHVRIISTNPVKQDTMFHLKLLFF